jgi:hypothetical protein
VDINGFFLIDLVFGLKFFFFFLTFYDENMLDLNESMEEGMGIVLIVVNLCAYEKTIK